LSYEDLCELYAEDQNDFPTGYPLSYSEIAHETSLDAAIQKARRTKPDRYKTEQRLFAGKSFTLVTREGKIVLPKSLTKRAVEWYHNNLCHPGETRTELTIGQHYCFPGMRNLVKAVCSKCASCQLNKKHQLKYGKIPPKDPDIIPWDVLCIDLIGPYVITVDMNGNKKEIILHCLTMIDPATGWFEIVEIPNKRADYVSNILQQTWLVRYPWPTKVICDRGSEFMAETKDMLENEYGIKQQVITTRNPQANSMVERAHQTLHQLIRSHDLANNPDLDLDDPFSGILSACAFAMRTTVHTTNRATPSQLVFGRDAIHNTVFKADWQYIADRKRHRIIQNNKKENNTRRQHVYQVGDKVIITENPNRKHGSSMHKSPQTVETVYDNGTVKLKRDTPRGGAVYQTWNIRNLTPYKD
jgi:hypothetical protein